MLSVTRLFFSFPINVHLGPPQFALVSIRTGLFLRNNEKGLWSKFCALVYRH